MNNQMDKSKFLEWLDGEDAAVLWEGPDGLMKYDMLVEAINSGEFAPDTPPVPTIKPGDRKYKCSVCKKYSPAIKWNHATLSYFGTDKIMLIEDAEDGLSTFVCPACGLAHKYKDLEVVE